MTDSSAANLKVSPEQLRAKYLQERDKRLRADGSSQYIDFERVFDDLDIDPYVEPGFTRDPVIEDLDVVVVGAGFGGLLTAGRIRQKGVKSIRILDKAGDFGGTWYWNRYPGAACDVEAYVYLPMLEETGYMPTERYAKADEIFRYCQLLGRHFDLYPHALFQTQVEGVRWDEAATRWIVTTHRGDILRARFAIVAGGILQRPKLPGIPGIESFAGKTFHTSRWDYRYTGGSPSQPMDKLADKVVGIIGTGATSVQAIPKLAESAGRLYVFQRTPSAVGVRANAPTDPEWVKGLKPGWQQERMDNFLHIVSGVPQERDLIKDGWTQIWHQTIDALDPDPARFAEARQSADYKAMEAIRGRIDEIVQDRAAAEALKPWYNTMCKRPCFHDEYLAAYNQPNVTLVDTEGKGVERITPDGVVVAGKEYKVDLLIYGSGFEVSTPLEKQLGFKIQGRDGKTIGEAWKNGANTLHGFYPRGFPNLMLMYTTQGGQSVNYAHILNEQAPHLAYVVDHCLKHDVETMEASEAATEEWARVISERAMGWATFTAECTPGYYNNEGGRGGGAGALRSTAFMGPGPEFVKCLHDWRKAGDLPGLQFTYR